MSDLFPVFLKLARRSCLVVGAGEVATHKIKGLLAAGAHIHVVAPQATDCVRDLASADQLVWSPRRFEPADLDGIFLVIAATGDSAINDVIFQLCDARQILCNAVDEPERCHFYYPAVVKRGDLQIAISTNGQSPALAQRLRAELEQLFDAGYEPWLRWLGSVRQLFFQRQLDPERRRQTLHRIASREVYERFKTSTRRRHGESL